MKKKPALQTVFPTLFFILCSAAAWSGDDVIGWRVNGTGLYNDANPPMEWSAEKNVLWKTKMSDWSNSQAIMVGDRLFVNSEPFSLVCVDSRTGKLLWERANTYEDVFSEAELARLRDGVEEKVRPLREEYAKIEAEADALREEYRKTEDDKLRGKIRGKRLKLSQLIKEINKIDPLNLPRKHRDNGYSSAVPVSDGKHVYAVYGNGVASCFDLEGNRIWSRMLEKPDHGWGHSASPALSGDTLIVHVLDVFGLDKHTGKERWRTPSKEGWGTPVVTKIGEEPVVITAAKGDVIRVSDGEKLAKEIGGLGFATPIIKDGKLYLMENEASVLALPNKLEDQTQFETLWTSKIKGSRHYASSVIHDGLIYAVSREGWLSVLKESDGKLVYEKELEINQDNTNSVYPSLSLAGGHIYIGFEEGVVLVLKPGETYQEVARNELESFRGTPLFHGDRVYIRGLEHFYCLAASDGP